MSLHLTHKRAVFSALGFIFLVVVFLFVGFGYYLMHPLKNGEPDQIFYVKEGLTLKQVAADLEQQGLITGKRLFLLWARLMGYSKNIKAGEYLLHAGMPPLRILNILSRGSVVTHPLTIPEGFTRKQIAEALEKNGLGIKEEFLKLTAQETLAQHYGISAPNLEGYLYPDTYLLSRGMSARAVIDMMVRRFWEVTGPLKDRAAALGMAMEEIVTLASIVEKETGLSRERPIIAGVFLNRLKKGIRLESDPTVIYGIENFNGNLTRKDLREPTPYNTYVIRGLPPGPIANPGSAAIRAVLYPEETEHLYFVSRNDGSHHFSKTLREHRRAVETYQMRRRGRRQ